MQFIPFIVAIAFILLGLKTVITQEATVSVRLWGNDHWPPRQDSAGYATSEHTGIVAVLVGVAEIAIGVSILFRGTSLFD